MAVTLVDTLLVFHGQESRLFGLWDGLLAGLQKQAGFISGVLMQAMSTEGNAPAAPFSHVSLVTFAADTDCAAALEDPAVTALFGDLRSVCLISPGLFAPIRQINAGRLYNNAGAS